MWFLKRWRRVDTTGINKKTSLGSETLVKIKLRFKNVFEKGHVTMVQSRNSY